MSYQKSLSRKIRKIIFHSPVMLITLLSYLRKQAELYQNEDSESHVVFGGGLVWIFVWGFCGLVVGFFFFFPSPEWVWTSLLMGFLFCIVTRSLMKSLDRWLKISSCFCSDLQNSLPLNCSSLKPSSLYFGAFGIMFCSIKLPIPASWLYFLSFFWGRKQWD